ncbi:MAG: PIN domain nuclease [Verrucomicrobiota bacterium]|jgi:predicted nucleic acid-binding protein
MKNKALDARTYKFSTKDRVLIDANVWIYIHGPSVPGDPIVQSYAAILSKLLMASIRPVLDVLVLGEFINRCARIEYERQDPPNASGKRVYRNFKDFRGSSAFPPIAKDIANNCIPLVGACDRVDHSFSEWKIADILNDFSTGRFDCTDQFLVESCRKHGLSLLTNDKDFTDGGITLLTTNPKLLAACPP